MFKNNPRDPPARAPPAPPPPSGFRLKLDASSDFPKPLSCICFDADGSSPIFLGSALFPDSSVHPCKIAPQLTPACRVPYGGVEVLHYGRYDLLPFDPDTMEWVQTSQGRVPHGCQPVRGGVEENGMLLYHAIADIDGVEVPGKTGEHLGGCNIAFQGTEVVITDMYQILCWKDLDLI